MKFKQSENQGTAGQGLLLNYGGLGGGVGHVHCAGACTGHIADGCGSKLWQWLATEVLTRLLPPNCPNSKYGFMG